MSGAGAARCRGVVGHEAAEHRGVPGRDPEGRDAEQEPSVTAMTPAYSVDGRPHDTPIPSRPGCRGTATPRCGAGRRRGIPQGPRSAPTTALRPRACIDMPIGSRRGVATAPGLPGLGGAVGYPGQRRAFRNRTDVLGAGRPHEHRPPRTHVPAGRWRAVAAPGHGDTGPRVAGTHAACLGGGSGPAARPRDLSRAASAGSAACVAARRRRRPDRAP